MSRDAVNSQAYDKVPVRDLGRGFEIQRPGYITLLNIKKLFIMA